MTDASMEKMFIFVEEVNCRLTALQRFPPFVYKRFIADCQRKTANTANSLKKSAGQSVTPLFRMY